MGSTGRWECPDVGSPDKGSFIVYHKHEIDNYIIPLYIVCKCLSISKYYNF